MHICVKCFQSIMPPSPLVTYAGDYYHVDCLRCYKCWDSLSNKKFIKEKFDKLICEECNSRYAPKCHRCYGAFESGESYKTVGGDAYHNDCFKCAGPCRKPIKAEFVVTKNDKYVCTSCNEKYGNDAVTY